MFHFTLPPTVGVFDHQVRVFRSHRVWVGHVGVPDGTEVPDDVVVHLERLDLLTDEHVLFLRELDQN